MSTSKREAGGAGVFAFKVALILFGGVSSIRLGISSFLVLTRLESVDRLAVFRERGVLNFFSCTFVLELFLDFVESASLSTDGDGGFGVFRRTIMGPFFSSGEALGVPSSSGISARESRRKEDGPIMWLMSFALMVDFCERPVDPD